jgi:hypothetical protein
MARAAVSHKNFFVAKFRDSESSPRPIQPRSRLAEEARIVFSCAIRIAKTTAAQWFYLILTFDNVDRSRVFRIAHDMRLAIVASCASLALFFPRQHFLKREAVFFDVLVYSGWRASRFPSARSD